MKIPKDKATRIDQQLIVPQRYGEEGLNAAKRSLSIDILEEVAKKIKIYETREKDVVKLRADILLVNFEDLKETQGKDEHTTDEQKAKELAFESPQCQMYIDNKCTQNFPCDRFKVALEMAKWKDEQLEKKIKKIKRDIVLSSDRKGGYEQNRVVKVDWVLRLIDEIMKGE